MKRLLLLLLALAAAAPVAVVAEGISSEQGSPRRRLPTRRSSAQPLATFESRIDALLAAPQ